MTTHQYADLEEAFEQTEFCIFCEARDSLNASSNLRLAIHKGRYVREALLTELTRYIDATQSRINELTEIKNELEEMEVTE